MHRCRNIWAILLLTILLPVNSDAQILQKIFGKKNSLKVELKEFKQVMPDNLTYQHITGITLENIWDDVWGGAEYIPKIYFLPKSKSSNYEGTFSLKQYTLDLAKREQNEYILATIVEEIEEELDIYTEIPEEYDIWSNTTIDPYNANLSNIKDTIRIDVSSYNSPGYKYVTSEFGPRRGRLHAGIDLKVYTGDTIYCAFEKGIVRIKRYNRRGYGNYVVIRHDNGLETLYGHMSKVLVKEGDKLNAGDPIGLGGSTGRSSGSHLHFELRYLGKPINPRDALDFNSHTVHNKTLVLTKDNFRHPIGRKGRKSTKSRNSTSLNNVSLDSKTIIVRKGDTLGAIARRNGTTVAKLKSLNNIKGTNIRAGQKLRIQ